MIKRPAKQDMGQRLAAQQLRGPRKILEPKPWSACWNVLLIASSQWDHSQLIRPIRFGYFFPVLAFICLLNAGNTVLADETSLYSSLRDHPRCGQTPSMLAAQMFSSAIRKHSQNDLVGAIADYLAALKISDTDPAVHWYLGTAYKASGQLDQAKREFAREVQMNSKFRFVPGQGLTKSKQGE
jgi:tetratricopeptide (TPR) repeat protein